MERARCPWPGTDPQMIAYHDHEWGVPVRDDRTQFEFLVLETFQAGLSWRIILHKRDGFRRAFAEFDASQVARFGEPDLARLALDPGIVRNRQKIRAAVANARAFLAVQADHGSFSDYLWRFVDGVPIVNRWKALGDLPPMTPLAERISRDLKERGFGFVGPTVVYAHLQATGMVNDHLVGCFRHPG